MDAHQPLTGFRVLTIALNLPGPLAAHRLRTLGAEICKFEPPTGDPLEFAHPGLYRQLHEGISIRREDLKSPEGMKEIEAELGRTDLFLTSSRLGALDRLGLGWARVGELFPRLTMVGIVGNAPPAENHPGHDLTYQAQHGLVTPPSLPKSLFADLGGAMEGVTMALGLLLRRERGGAGPRMGIVSLEESAAYFGQPVRWGLTQPSGFLGGALPQYNLYRCEKGWIALAALEPHFWSRLQSVSGLSHPSFDELQAYFSTQSADHWQKWAEQNDLPLVSVRDTGL